MHRRSTLIVTAFAAAVLLVWAGAFAQNQAPAKATAVAVVDIDLVFNQLKQRQSIEADLRTQGDALQAEERERKTKIADLQGGLDLLPPGSDAYNKKQEELQMKVLELQVWAQFQQQKMARERALRVESLYKKAMDTIGKIATQSGYDLVLFKDPAPTFEGANMQQINAQLTLRKVLWSNTAIDITDAVITRMNNDFGAGN